MGAKSDKTGEISKLSVSAIQAMIANGEIKRTDYTNSVIIAKLPTVKGSILPFVVELRSIDVDGDDVRKNKIMNIYRIASKFMSKEIIDNDISTLRLSDQWIIDVLRSNSPEEFISIDGFVAVSSRT